MYNRKKLVNATLVTIFCAAMTANASMGHTKNIINTSAENKSICSKEQFSVIAKDLPVVGNPLFPSAQNFTITDKIIEAPVVREIQVPQRIYYNIPMSHELQDIVIDTCAIYGIDEKVVFAQIDAESSFDINKIGDNGDSIGLMQIQPKWYQEELIQQGIDLYNPVQNIQFGIKLLAENISRANGDIWLGLAKYNAGPQKETLTEYVNHVQDSLQRIIPE